MGHTFKYANKYDDNLKRVEYKIFKRENILGKREKKDSKIKNKTEKKNLLKFDEIST